MRGDRAVSPAHRKVPVSHSHQLVVPEAGRRLPAGQQLPAAVGAARVPANREAHRQNPEHRRVRPQDLQRDPLQRPGGQGADPADVGQRRAHHTRTRPGAPQHPDELGLAQRRRGGVGHLRGRAVRRPVEIVRREHVQQDLQHDPRHLDGRRDEARADPHPEAHAPRHDHRDHGQDAVHRSAGKIPGSRFRRGHVENPQPVGPVDSGRRAQTNRTALKLFERRQASIGLQVRHRRSPRDRQGRRPLLVGTDHQQVGRFLRGYGRRRRFESGRHKCVRTADEVAGRMPIVLQRQRPSHENVRRQIDFTTSVDCGKRGQSIDECGVLLFRRRTFLGKRCQYN